jgi:serralysin
VPTEPTSDEQYFLELVNRERAKAGAQPLAFDSSLNAAADSHSSWMLSTDTFSHTGAGGSSAGDRITAAGYTGWNSWAENIALQSLQSPTGLRDEADRMHSGLMNSPGHKANILNTNLREIGIGLQSGEYRGGNAAVVTEVFGRQGGAAILTGVAYKDADGDRFYDPGEGLGGVTVKAVGAGGSFSATSMASGGYQLDLGAGTYTVTFAGNGVGYSKQVTIGAQNVKLDATGTGTTQPQPDPEPQPGPVPDTPVAHDLPASADPTRTITGSRYDDKIYGSQGHDLIDGRQGADQMIGRGGDDTYRVDQAGDRIVESQDRGIDTVLSSTTRFTLPDHVENLTLVGTASQVATGNRLDNILTGNDTRSFLSGSNGDDVLIVREGSARLTGGSGADLFVFESAGADRHIVDFKPGADRIDLSDLFEDYAGTDPVADRHLLIGKNASGGTDIKVDMDGVGGKAAVLVASLDGILPSALQVQHDLAWS